MVGISGTSSTGALHCYYGCKGKKGKACKRKNLQKDYIEDLVIDLALSTLTDENINEISAAVYKAASKEQDHQRLKQLQREILKIERQKNNLLNALQECEITDLRKPIFEQLKALEARKLEVEKEIRIEECNQFTYTIPQIKAFFKSLKKKENRNDMQYKKMIINSLINKVYVYETSLTIVFNTQDKDLTAKIPEIEDLERSFSSFYGINARPKIETFTVSIFYVLGYFKPFFIYQTFSNSLYICVIAFKITFSYILLNAIIAFNKFINKKSIE